MSMTAIYQCNNEPWLRVVCVNQALHGYAPVLIIGDVTVFPTRQQLERIGKAIALYFEAETTAAKAGPAAVVESQKCDHCDQVFIGEPGQSTADTVLCPECVKKAVAAMHPDVTLDPPMMRGVPVPYQP